MSNTSDPRRAAFALVADGIDCGLPAPFYVQTSPDDDVRRGTAVIQLDDDDREGVDRWVAWLSLPRPELGLSPMHCNDRWFQPYESMGRHPVTGRTVWVKSHVTVPAPTEQPKESVR